MRLTSCPQEEMTLKAVRTRMWEGSLSAHVAGCAVCAEIVQVSRWMQGLAEGPEKTAAMPDGGRLWRRAQLSKKLEEAERAEKILDWAELSLRSLWAPVWRFGSLGIGMRSRHGWHHFWRMCGHSFGVEFPWQVLPRACIRSAL